MRTGKLVYFMTGSIKPIRHKVIFLAGFHISVHNLFTVIDRLGNGNCYTDWVLGNGNFSCILAVSGSICHQQISLFSLY